MTFPLSSEIEDSTSSTTSTSTPPLSLPHTLKTTNTCLLSASCLHNRVWRCASTEYKLHTPLQCDPFRKVQEALYPPGTGNFVTIGMPATYHLSSTSWPATKLKDPNMDTGVPEQAGKILCLGVHNCGLQSCNPQHQ